jgi:hypothetical protein
MRSFRMGFSHSLYDVVSHSGECVTSRRLLTTIDFTIIKEFSYVRITKIVQPKLFEKPAESVDIETVLLYALGDFQSRGKVLADRELAFDRLRGAFLRAFEKFGIAMPPDEKIVDELRSLGAQVTEVPSFVAKRPFRITVSPESASQSSKLFGRLNSHEKP